MPVGTEALQSFFSAPAGIASGEKSGFSGLVMPRSVAQTKARFTGPLASRCFPVRHCSPLFAIVRHCSAKKYCPAPVPSRRPVAAFLRVVERHGAAMGGMGGRRPPRRQHGLLGFHQPRDTQHGFSLFLRRLQGEQPQARPTGFSRITSHGLYAFLPTTSRHFPLFFGYPPSPGAGVRSPSAAAPATLRAASAASNAK